MLYPIFISLAFFAARIQSFYISNRSPRIASSLFSAKEKRIVPVDIVAREIELTDTLRSRVEDKIERTLLRLGHDVLSASVVLRVIKFPVEEVHSQTTKKDSQIAEVTVGFKGGAVLHASERTEDMYASIDIVSHKLAQSMKKHNEKLRGKRFKEKSLLKPSANGGLSPEDLAEVEALTPVFNEEELLIDLDQKYKDVLKPPASSGKDKMEVIRPKYFPMPPISVTAALNALELIDHPFYVFRNEETNEINVVYRRTHGGVGLIMPMAENKQ